MSYKSEMGTIILNFKRPKLTKSAKSLDLKVQLLTADHPSGPQHVACFCLSAKIPTRNN